MTALPPRLRRALVVGAAMLTLVLLAGATYQGVATALERRQFPHPGQLVDVGGHQLHIHCTGAGVPTVVLEAPAIGMSEAWGWVQPAVAATTRVCSYDRAGLGWSEAGDRRFDPARVPEDLHALLERSREHAPFVVAGHGLGAAFARMYAAGYPGETAALVLIDPPWAMSPPVADGRAETMIDLFPWLARAGILRASGTLSRRAAGLPGTSGGAMRAFLNRPDHLTRAARELDDWGATIRLARLSEPNPALPSFTVTADESGGATILARRERSEIVAREIIRAVAQVRGRH